MNKLSRSCPAERRRFIRPAVFVREKPSDQLQRLENENSVLVDNAGVTKNVAKMRDEYARSIGKSRNELHATGKDTARSKRHYERNSVPGGRCSKYTKTYARAPGNAKQDSARYHVIHRKRLKPGAGAGLKA